MPSQRGVDCSSVQKMVQKTHKFSFCHLRKGNALVSLIEVQALTKTYRQAVRQPGLRGAFRHLVHQRYTERVAVDHIDMSIERGETVAYVGPNGAGKSTTIKMLTGILVPTSGQVTVDGIVPYKRRMENARKIGVVFGQRTQLWWDIPVIETLSLLRDIHEMPAQEYRKNLDLLTELLGLDEFMHLTARRISLGQRMRADLAAAFLHSPTIVYLDEPTIGLDIAVKERIRGFIKQVNRELGTTVMLTTHDLGDIQDLCKRIVIIDHGRIIFDGLLADVTETFARERVLHFQLRTPCPAAEQALQRIPNVTVSGQSDTELSVRFDRAFISARDITSAIMQIADISDFRIDEPSIDHVIKQVYDGTLNLAVHEEGSA